MPCFVTKKDWAELQLCRRPQCKVFFLFHFSWYFRRFSGNGWVWILNVIKSGEGSTICDKSGQREEGRIKRGEKSGRHLWALPNIGNFLRTRCIDFGGIGRMTGGSPQIIPNIKTKKQII